MVAESRKISGPAQMQAWSDLDVGNHVGSPLHGARVDDLGFRFK
eukprot:SAG31_NODE_4292_length_3375_cov_9.381868_2_plen_44_part_00